MRIPEGLGPDEYVASFPADGGILTRDHQAGLGALGLSANMGARRASFSELGWFDEALSPGTPLYAGEDFDLVIRAVESGLRVQNLPELEVLHLGIRCGAAARRLHIDYVVASGACYGKHARLGNPTFRRVFIKLLWSNVSGVVTRALLNRRPVGAYALVAFLQGALDSLRYGIDPRTGLFVGRLSRRPVRLLRRQPAGPHIR